MRKSLQKAICVFRNHHLSVLAPMSFLSFEWMERCTSSCEVGYCSSVCGFAYSFCFLGFFRSFWETYRKLCPTLNPTSLAGFSVIFFRTPGRLTNKKNLAKKCSDFFWWREMFLQPIAKLQVHSVLLFKTKFSKPYTSSCPK